MINFDLPENAEIKRFVEGLLMGINSVMESKGFSFEYSGVPTVGPRYVTAGLKIKDPTKVVSVLGLGEAFEHACASRCTVTLNRAVVEIGFEMPNAKPDVSVENLQPGQVGIATDNSPVMFEFSDKHPHTIVCGASGSGKSQLTRTIIASLVRKYDPGELRIGIVDPHRDYEDFYGLTHLIEIVHNQEKIDELIDKFYQEVSARADNNLRTGVRLLLVLDEAQDSTVLGDKDTPNQNMAKIRTIARQARKFNVHLLVSTQKPTHSDLPGLFDNLSNRYVGRVVDPVVGTKLTGRSGSGAHLLMGQGDFFHINDDIVRFQAGTTDSGFIKKLPHGWTPPPFMRVDKEISASVVVPEIVAEMLRPVVPKSVLSTLGPKTLSLHENFTSRIKAVIGEVL